MLVIIGTRFVRGRGRLSLHFVGLAMFAGVWQAGSMKKQASDQAFHDRRYQERKREEAQRKAPKKKVVAEAEKKSSHLGG
ncbi:MAG: hypothetical protein WBF26_18650 [Candidatus Sulfotelmatobacter sp.]